MSIHRACKNCQFWHPNKYPQDQATNAECWFEPPTADSTRRRPIVGATEWCGRFKVPDPQYYND